MVSFNYGRGRIIWINTTHLGYEQHCVKKVVNRFSIAQHSNKSAGGFINVGDLFQLVAIKVKCRITLRMLKGWPTPSSWHCQTHCKCKLVWDVLIHFQYPRGIIKGVQTKMPLNAIRWTYNRLEQRDMWCSPELLNVIAQRALLKAQVKYKLIKSHWIVV